MDMQWDRFVVSIWDRQGLAFIVYIWRDAYRYSNVCTWGNMSLNVDHSNEICLRWSTYTIDNCHREISCVLAGDLSMSWSGNNESLLVPIIPLNGEAGTSNLWTWKQCLCCALSFPATFSNWCACVQVYIHICRYVETEVMLDKPTECV